MKVLPLEKNTLSTMVKRMCVDAGIEHDHKSNHSLRATGATAMFQSNAPEEIIQKTTGHRSIEALRTYERISTDQHKEVTKVLLQPKPQVQLTFVESEGLCEM